MKTKCALIVLSGGQDSTTCLYWAIQKYGIQNISAIGFIYGQRHRAELNAANEICTKMEIPYTIMNLSLLGDITSNALTRSDMSIDGIDYIGEYPNTFVDGRNHLFLSFAAIYAKQQGIRDIVTGICQTDFSGYPDCRDVFIKSLNVTLNLAMDFDFNIITPLMWMNKAETWALAEDLNCIDTIKHKTLTCYEGIIGDGCGKCPACVLRRRGFEEYKRRKQQIGQSNK